MVKIFLVALVVIFVHKTDGIYECCPGAKIYRTSRLCSDNSTINLTCNEKELALLMDENDLPPNYFILDNGTLIDNTNATEPTRIK